MEGKTWIIAGAVCGAIGVGLGAFGAHGLEDALKRLTPDDVAVNVQTAGRSAETASPAAERDGEVVGQSRSSEVQKRMAWFDTGVRYLMYHAFALLLLGMLAGRYRSWWLTASGALFVAGMVLFSGLLFAMTFGGPRILGAIVPLGGLAMIFGWLAMAAGVVRAQYAKYSD
jgi:uncharacterized membrane protein YgdD (TMEM256/DUF423 family)